jgi:uncharacterized membrane protein YdbT with pleckstrin-like domain
VGYVESLLGKNEKIMIVARQHWTTLVLTFVINFFLAALLIVVAVLLNNQPFIKDSAILKYVPIVLLIALLYPLIRLGWDVLRWSAEEYIVTTHRVMQTEGIINKQTIDSSLEKVNDILLTQSFFGRLLGYGELEIITGSDKGINIFHRLANPSKFKTTLLDQKVALGHDSAGEDLPRSKPGPAAPADEEEDPLKRIADLDDLRKRGAISDQEYQTAKSKLLSKL